MNNHLSRIERILKGLVGKIGNESPTQLAASLLVAHSALQVELLNRHLSSPTHLLAYPCRTLCELNFILRCVLKSPEDANEWIVERGFDEREMLERFIEGKAGNAVDVLRARIHTIEEAAKMTGMALKKPLHVSERAKMAGLAEEYRVEYKFYSKLTHPTSLMVNAPWEEIQSSEYQSLLLMNGQKYALDTAERVRAYFQLEPFVEIA